MPAHGTPWDKVRAAFKAECKRDNLPCWICGGSKGPIDYTSPYKREGGQPLLFSADHVSPTSLGGDALRRANLKPAHYQRLQLEQRQRHTRSVPHLTEVVTMTMHKGMSREHRSRPIDALRGRGNPQADRRYKYHRGDHVSLPMEKQGWLGCQK
jgi:hypothetical protein